MTSSIFLHCQANAALYRVVIVRMRHHDPTKAYVARRKSECKTKTEIIRGLKRLLARELWVRNDAAANPSMPPDVLRRLLLGSDEKVHESAASNPTTPPELLAEIDLPHRLVSTFGGES